MLLRVHQKQVQLQCQAVLVGSHDFNSAMTTGDMTRVSSGDARNEGCGLSSGRAILTAVSEYLSGGGQFPPHGLPPIFSSASAFSPNPPNAQVTQCYKGLGCWETAAMDYEKRHATPVANSFRIRRLTTIRALRPGRRRFGPRERGLGGVHVLVDEAPVGLAQLRVFAGPSELRRAHPV
jgi:hypothetical protein